jgi:transposase
MAYATLLTGPERRRRWPEDERRRLVAPAFAPGAVVTQVARDNDVSTSLIYKWRQAAAAERDQMFVPAVLAEPWLGFSAEPSAAAGSITVDLPGGGRVSIGSGASVALMTATLRAMR